MPNDDALRDELLRMAQEDLELREELARDGSLFAEGYHPRMEALHRRNAARLKQIFREHGFPTPVSVERDGVHAAWLILQHAIGDPELQREGLRLMRQALDAGEDVNPVHVAMLEDRILVLEGKPQIYGTSMDWNEAGELVALPIADAEHVEERRRAAGFTETVAERVRRAREEAARGGERAPANFEQRKRRFEQWCRDVGWRS